MLDYNQMQIGRNDRGGAREGGVPLSFPSATLGNTTSLQSAPETGLISRRITRYLLQAVIGEILPGERISTCLRLIIPGKSHVKVLYSPGLKRAHYGNLIVCGSVWGCPVCSAKITERRRIEVEPAISNWSGSVAMGAFTMQHDISQPLSLVKKKLYDSYTTMQEGRFYQHIKQKYGIAGTIGSSEVTWGPINGWHPHKHNLLFFWDKLTETDIEDLESEISENFREKINKAGGYAHPDYSVKFSLGNGSAEKDYVYKWGLDYEIAKSPVKKARGENYSPFELARWAISGEYQPVCLFREYFKNFKGSHQLSYSKGLRDLLDLSIEKTDLEVCQEQDQDAFQLAEIGRSIWSIVCRKGLRGELIEVASAGDPEILNSYIENIVTLWGTESPQESHSEELG